MVSAVMQSIAQSGRAALKLLAVTLLAGCINTPLPDYYVLTPESGSAGVSAALADLALGPKKFEIRKWSITFFSILIIMWKSFLITSFTDVRRTKHHVKVSYIIFALG